MMKKMIRLANRVWWTMTCPACGQDPCNNSTTDCRG